MKLKNSIKKYTHNCRRWTVSGNNTVSILNAASSSYSLAADLAKIPLGTLGAFTVKKAQDISKKEY